MRSVSRETNGVQQRRSGSHWIFSTSPGFTLLELAAVISLATISATTGFSGLTALRDAAALSTARQQLAGALEHARTEAYRLGTTVDARPIRNGQALSVAIAGSEETTFDLRDSRIVGVPARGYVRFFASGLAQNATFTVAVESGPQADVVVNQRGEIRWRG